MVKFSNKLEGVNFQCEANLVRVIELQICSKWKQNWSLADIFCQRLGLLNCGGAPEINKCIQTEK